MFPTKGDVLKLDKDFVIQELRKQGKNEHVQKALQELPDKIDHEQHAQILEKFGIDPGHLAQKFAERELGTPTP
ncbi:MAG: hypothetical protein QOH02_331 [Gaiellaceae bacterium]|jgi:hypothetical protein|nr:hypothetical protein [Gaiellaceae bacterium]